MTIYDESLEFHEKNKGKLEVISKVPIKNARDLSLAYTPGVAEPCRRINANVEDVYKYTTKGNMIAVVTDGTAVLGLGDIGPEAGLPVMEGKCALFKTFGDVDAIPICIASKNVDDIVKTVKLISPSLGGINLEDISAPRCFEVESRLKAELDIPVFHDDQHGTAVVVLSALLSALKLEKKEMKDISIVINGAGSAGIAIAKLLIKSGAGDVTLCDKAGALYKGKEGMNPAQESMAEITNKRMVKGTLKDAMAGANVFIGVSAPGVVTKDMVSSMAPGAMVFPMANPTPEIFPEEAKAAGARIVGTGRSDYPNQINNVLAFPGIFRGALDVRAREINDEMKIAAAYAIANSVSSEELSEEYIMPHAFDKNVSMNVAKAVAEAARKSGVARL
jgi:Malic enzyme